MFGAIMNGGPKALAKRIAFAALGSAPVVRQRLSRSLQHGRLTILAFHRVGPPDGSAYVPLETELFDEAIGFCRRHFALLTFAELDHFRAGDRPPMIVTFDDGYRDFVDHAVPVLRRHGVRVNHNIIPGCVDSGLPPFNVLVQDYVGKAPRALVEALDVPGFGPLHAEQGREALGRRLSAFIKNKRFDEQQRLAEHLKEQFAAFDGIAPTPMMNLGDVRAIADEHELGVHSFDHASLALESDEYVRADARKCRKWFENRLGRATDIYALPNGSGTDRTSHILRGEGFRHILFTRESFSSPSGDEHDRFTIAGRSPGEIRARVSGWTNPRPPAR